MRTYTQNDIERLKNQIEKVVEKKMLSPRDFCYLSHQVEGVVNEKISISTLKRIWGYTITSSKFSQHSLDMLSRMVGYSGWEDFLDEKADSPTSHFLVSKKLFSKSLETGEKVRLTWLPDRVILLAYKGDNKFTILEATNSKLKAGDSFHCEQFVANEPLMLCHLIRPDMQPCDYICGKTGGIRWSFPEMGAEGTATDSMTTAEK